MRPFVTEIEASGAATVGADFAMSGMDMVPNRYHLRRENDGYWRASVVLPVCVSGREDWVLTLMIDDAKVALPFSVGR